MIPYYVATYGGEIEVFGKKRILFLDIYSPDGTLYRDHVCASTKHFPTYSLQQRRKLKIKSRRKLPTCENGTRIMFMATPYEYTHLDEIKKGLRDIRCLVPEKDYIRI